MNPIIYIIVISYPYEGDSVQGYTTDEEEAKAICEMMNNQNDGRGCGGGGIWNYETQTEPLTVAKLKEWNRL